MKAYGVVYVEIHIFSTSALVWDEWSASRLGRFAPGERAAGTHWIGGWEGPKTGLDDVEKRKFFTLCSRDSNSEPSVVQPVASRYTDWANITVNNWSRGSSVDMAMSLGWTTGILFPAEARDIYFLYSVQSGSGAQLASCLMVPGVLSPWVKRPGRGADH
jgi:hypothetical protein